jgi:PPK2 family polyphosphate:nucleotide phosphotransferase
MHLRPLQLGAVPALTDAAAKPPSDLPDKEELGDQLDDLARRMAKLQTALYAEGTRALLVVLQGRDTAGKDGVVRHVFGELHPLGLDLTSFKVPTPEEASHDFLWRIHKAVPAKGRIGIFNRSHYEDVLVVRVHGLVPEPVWRARYEQINGFERFCLHISREEQRERLLARLDAPEKNWKFNAADLKERQLWDDYTKAYEEALASTSTAWAPWYVVPSDRKPVRDLLIAEVVLETLAKMNPVYPPVPKEVADLRKLLKR